MRAATWSVAVTVCSVAVLTSACSTFDKALGTGGSSPEFTAAEVDITEVTITDPEPGTDVTIDASTLPKSTLLSGSGAAAQSEVTQKVSTLLSGFETRDGASGETVLVVPEAVLFEFGQSALKTVSKDTLKKVAELISLSGDQNVKVVGHADSIDSDAVNQQLSTARAEAVRAFLVEQGVAEGRVTAEGKGETVPLVPNTNDDGSDNPDNRAKNRRVEILIDSLPGK